MCKEEFIIFNVSNRGSNVFQTITNVEYAVNIPSELRTKKSKFIKVEVTQGNICFQSSNETKTLKELGIRSNLVSGFSTEVEGSFNTTNNNKLFSVDLQNYQNGPLTNAISQSCNLNTNSSFIISQMPEKLIFSRYKVIAGIAENSLKNDYISFTLRLTYFMDE